MKELSEKQREEYEELIMDVDTNIKVSDVILSNENKKKIEQLIREINNKEKIFECGLEISNKIIMYGASGTGKTFLTKALANELGYRMLYVDISSALASGSASKNIRRIFELGRQIKEAIIFLDECDAITWNRDLSQGDTGEMRRATNALFQCMDQMSKDNIFIAATNMLHRVDIAFERRFDIKMQFRTPDTSIDECINKFVNKDKFGIKDDATDSAKELINRRFHEYEKASYYAIKKIVHREMKEAVINETYVVNTSKIYKEIANEVNFNTKFDVKESKKDKWKE